MHSDRPSESNAPETLDAELSAHRFRELQQADAIEALRKRNADLEAQFAGQRSEILRLERELAMARAAQRPSGNGAAALGEANTALQNHLRALQDEQTRLKRQLATLGERESRHQGWERRVQVLHLFSQRQALLHCVEQLVFLVEGLSAEVRVMMHSAQMRIGKKIEGLFPQGVRNSPAWHAYLIKRNREYGKWKHNYRERMKFNTPHELCTATLRAVAEAQPTRDIARLDALVSEIRRESQELAKDVQYLLHAYATLSAWVQEVRSARCFQLGELVVCQLVKLRLRPKSAGFLQRIDSLDHVFAKWAEAYRKAGPPSVLPLPPLPPVRHR